MKRSLLILVAATLLLAGCATTPAVYTDFDPATNFGQYRTYQVPVKKIQAATGLDFGALVEADALHKHGIEESLPGVPTIVALDKLENMVL